jgi:outer membrane protein, multidrug efflux system
MRPAVSAFACVMALLLSACAVGPNYKKPNIAVQEGWQAAPASQPSVVINDPPPLAWWSTMKDPTLDWLVHEAWRGNLDIRIAKSRIREARAQRAVAGSSLFPDANVGSAYGYYRSEGPLFPLETGDYQFESAGFDAAWELDAFGGIRRGIEAAQDSLEAQVEAARGVLVTTVSEVARNYIELRTAQERTAIALQNVQTEKQTLELAQRLYIAGLVSQLDVTQAMAQLMTTEAELPVLKIQEQSAIHQLGILLGELPTDLLGELSHMGPVPPPPMRVPIGLPSDILRRRPDVAQVERQLASATAQIGVAEAELFPQFTLTGDFGLGVVPPADFMNWSNRYLAVGPAVRWEIFDGGRILANVDAHKAIRQELLDQYKLTILTAIGEVEDALVAFQRQQDEYDFLRQSVDSSQASLRISREQYAEGTVGFLSVLDSQRSLLVAQDSLAVTKGNIDLSMIALYKAVGGGWESFDQAAKSKTVASK